MTAHIHSELMMKYAQDAMETNTPWEKWEWREANSNEPWDELEANPTWCEYNEYRRKPSTININGREVPEPVREQPTHKTKYFIPSIQYHSLYDCSYWGDDPIDNHRLENGLIHLTQEAATAHAMALLSFTAKPEVSDE